jgi:hypothetical protein
MDRLTVETLSADYKIVGRHIIQAKENNCSVFSCNLNVRAFRLATEDGYKFVVQRSNVLLNGKKVTKLMDRVICEMGDSLYPISLKVSPELTLLDIYNFNDVVLRRKECAESMMEKYPASPVERYIHLSEKNFTNVRALIGALCRDGFFNLYFRNIYTPTREDEAYSIRWENFPERDMNRAYLYRIRAINEGKISVAGEIMKITPEFSGHYSADYTIGEYGEIQIITGQADTEYNGKRYVRQFSVEKSNMKTGTKKWENTIL